MHPVEALRQLGGTGTWSTWTRRTSVTEARRAVASGDVVRVAHNRYVLADVAGSQRVAASLGGVLCLADAALHHGWAVVATPPLPHVAVRRGRRLTTAQRRTATVHHLTLDPQETASGVTGRARTLTDCLRGLPVEQALAVADSALRSGDVTPVGLRDLVAQLRGPGSARARRVAALADGRAANPFESVLRHLAAQVAGLEVTPQLGIELPGLYVRPDLVDPGLRIVLEADSHAWHSSRSQLRRDCRRYTLLVAHGWTVLRFSYEDVMADPGYVVDVLSRVVASRRRPDHAS